MNATFMYMYLPVSFCRLRGTTAECFLVGFEWASVVLMLKLIN